MKAQLAIVAGLYLCGAVMAADPCPTPKPLNCAQIKDLAARRHCELDVVVMRGEQGPPGPQGAPGRDGITTVVPARLAGDRPDCDPVPCIPEKEKARPLLGFGLDYGEEHNVGLHAFGGVQFPKDEYGHNWQLQIGPTYMDHDRYRGLSRRPTSHGNYVDVPIEGPETGPWGISASAVVVF